MFRASLTGLDKKRLRLWLSLFFIALAIPTGVLIHQAYSQLKWEAFHQYQVLAKELVSRIDRRAQRLIGAEEARSFADYAFLTVTGDAGANFFQPSPLSAYPVTASIPGLIGYFQIDDQGVFSTPLLPRGRADPMEYGISSAQLRRRTALQERILRILSANRLVQEARADVAGAAVVRPKRLPAEKREEGDAAASLDDRPSTGTRYALREAAPAEPEVSAQAAFDQLNEPASQADRINKQATVSTLGRVEELKLQQRFGVENGTGRDRVLRRSAPLKKRAVRKEKTALPEAPAVVADAISEEAVAELPEVRVSTFESEIDPFELSLLDSGHFVLFRKVWRDGQRYIQGALIEHQPFLKGLTEAAFRAAAVSRMSDLVVAYSGDVFAVFAGRESRQYLSSAAELRGELLHQTRLSAPLNSLELIFSVNRMPPGPGAAVIIWLTVTLTAVLCGGLFLMYRLGTRQIELSRQQQDFVSAVSHELKTPLTSIRMYGEMLREGWAPEEKKNTYYDYIHDESERLSRLINNVLQLARMTRNELKVELRPSTGAELMDGIRSKVSTQVERAGFELNLGCTDEAAQAGIHVDADYFTQIIINLVDNALKFSAKSDRKQIDIGCRLTHDGALLFSVRDYGPGVPRDQMNKIFKLFYRSESELTRETVGTGIGLALVHQLALAMRGRVDVVNTGPGADFQVSFPL